MNEIDVVVVGAGAAGIGAAKWLQESAVDFAVLEARNRVGGRALTIPTIHGESVDLGCQWLHSAYQNPLVAIAEGLKFTVGYSSPADWRQRIGNYYGDDEQSDWLKARSAFEARLGAAASDERDHVASEFLAGTRWDALINAVSSWANGVELNHLSVKDYENYVETNLDLSIREGYGALIVTYAKSIPVKIHTPVTAIDHSGKSLIIKTPHGDLRAKAAIITVPTNLIADETIKFIPPCLDKMDYATNLPLGMVTKVFLYYRGSIDVAKRDKHFAGSPSRTETGSYQLFVRGFPIISAYFGGQLASDLEKAGQAAAVEFAIGELGQLFGNEFGGALVRLAVSEWGTDPWSKGAFSHALPEHSDDRERLGMPIDCDGSGRLDSFREE